MSFINGLCMLLLYQLAGELLARYFELPLPGPVIGMLLLLATLAVRRRIPESVDAASGALLSHLSLLFVPAGVGVMVHFDLIGAQWVPILAALLVSTVVSLTLSAIVMRTLARRGGVLEEDP